MGRKSNYNVGSRRYEITRALFTLGVCPYNAFQYIDKNFEMVRRILRKMTTDKEIIKKKTAYGRVYILSDFNSLPDDMKAAFPEELVEYYQSVAVKNRIDLYNKKEKVQRIYGTSDASILFHALTGHSYIFEKPFLLDEDSTLENMYCFYTSKEIKDTDGGIYHDVVSFDNGDKPHKNISTSRITGVYVTGHNTWFNIYELDGTNYTWSSNAERNMKRHVNTVMESKNVHGTEEGAVFFYGTNSAPAAVFFEDPFKKVTRKNLSVDRTYEQMYILPRDYNGFRIMRMMSGEDWRYNIMKQHLPEDKMMAANQQFDGFDHDNGYIYCDFCVPDLVKLKSAYLAISTGSWHGKIIIYCYDVQKELIETLFKRINTETEIRTVTIQETEEKYFG